MKLLPDEKIAKFVAHLTPDDTLFSNFMTLLFVVISAYFVFVAGAEISSRFFFLFPFSFSSFVNNTNLSHILFFAVEVPNQKQNWVKSL